MLKRGVYILTVKEKDGDKDKGSYLSRENVYRVNLGIRKKTFTELFGAVPKRTLFASTAISIVSCDFRYSMQDIAISSIRSENDLQENLLHDILNDNLKDCHSLVFLVSAVFCLYSVPHATITSKIGFKLYPVSVKVYSTRGRTSGYTFQVSNPLSSIERKLAVKTF